jgi:hypothetical protein
MLSRLDINRGTNCQQLSQPTEKKSMALTIAKMTRTFDFLGVRLPDPNPSMSVDDVKAFQIPVDGRVALATFAQR